MARDDCSAGLFHVRESFGLDGGEGSVSQRAVYVSCLDPIFARVGSSRLHLPPVPLPPLGVAFLIGQNRHLDSSYSLSYLVVTTPYGRVEQPLRINYALESAPPCLLVDRDCRLKLINDSRLDIPTGDCLGSLGTWRRIVELGGMMQSMPLFERESRTSIFLDFHFLRFVEISLIKGRGGGYIACREDCNWSR